MEPGNDAGPRRPPSVGRPRKLMPTPSLPVRIEWFDQLNIAGGVGLVVGLWVATLTAPNGARPRAHRYAPVSGMVPVDI